MIKVILHFSRDITYKYLKAIPQKRPNVSLESYVTKIENVIKNSNWTQEIMAGQKKRLRYSE